jgi:biopolymer transport protein TolQ
MENLKEALEAKMSATVLELVLGAGPVVKAVLVVLLMFSVVSWGIILFKYRYLSMAERQTRAFVRNLRPGADLKGLFLQAKALPLSPLAGLYRAAFLEGGQGRNLAAALRRQEAVEADRLHRYLSFLATTGSTTPFIGLFGTVWGIMNSFRGIGATGSASLAVVAPGIAEALVATAMGLFAAIPAVVAYNYYLSRARRLLSQTEGYAEELQEMFSRRPGEQSQ